MMEPPLADGNKICRITHQIRLGPTRSVLLASPLIWRLATWLLVCLSGRQHRAVDGREVVEQACLVRGRESNHRLQPAAALHPRLSLHQRVHVASQVRAHLHHQRAQRLERDLQLRQRLPGPHVGSAVAWVPEPRSAHAPSAHQQRQASVEGATADVAL
jgi:hypothetical protein